MIGAKRAIRSRALKNEVARSEHDTRTDNRGVRESGQNAAFAIGTGTHIIGSRSRIGADAGNVDQPRYSGLAGGHRQSRGAVDVDALECGVTLLDVEADGIDDGVTTLDDGNGRRRVTDVGSHQHRTSPGSGWALEI